MNLPPRSLPSVVAEDARLHASEASRRLFHMWDRVRGDKFAPAFGSDFHIDDIPYSMIPCVSIVDVVDGGKDYFYRFWGTRNVEVKGLELTGKLMSEGPLPQVIRYGYEQFSAVIERRAPTAFIYVGPYRSPIRRRQITFRFPLSRDGVAVDGILSYQDLDNQSQEWSTLFDDQWGGEKPDLVLRSIIEEQTGC